MDHFGRRGHRWMWVWFYQFWRLLLLRFFCAFHHRLYSNLLFGDLKRLLATICFLKGCVDLLSRSVIIINNVIQHLRKRWESFLDLLNITLQHSYSHLLQMIQNTIHGLNVLLFKYRASITTTHLFLSIDFVQIKTLYVGAFISSQEMRTVFRGTKWNLQRSVWEFITI